MTDPDDNNNLVAEKTVTVTYTESEYKLVVDLLFKTVYSKTVPVGDPLYRLLVKMLTR